MPQVLIVSPNSTKIKANVTQTMKVEYFFLLCPGKLSLPTDGLFQYLEERTANPNFYLGDISSSNTCGKL